MMLKPRGSFVPHRRGWTFSGRRLGFASTTSPGYSASPEAHRILWCPHPRRASPPLWLHRTRRGGSPARAVVASRHIVKPEELSLPTRSRDGSLYVPDVI